MGRPGVDRPGGTDRTVRDRVSIFGLLGGALGASSLFFPYVSATGSVLGFDVARVEYTLYDLLAETNEPALAAVLAASIVGGIVLAAVGAVMDPRISALGGLCKGIGAGAIAYVVATEEPTFALGIGTADLSPEPGLYLLAIGAVASLLAALE